MVIKFKRAYEGKSKDDGQRILVDRLWPRGLTKEELDIDLWLKDIAPSTELRKWFNHDPAKWPMFQDKYLNELNANPSPLLVKLVSDSKNQTITLVYGAKDTEHNNAVVIKNFLESI